MPNEGVPSCLLLLLHLLYVRDADERAGRSARRESDAMDAHDVASIDSRLFQEQPRHGDLGVCFTTVLLIVDHCTINSGVDAECRRGVASMCRHMHVKKTEQCVRREEGNFIVSYVHKEHRAT